jgi:hypothetical protein
MAALRQELTAGMVQSTPLVEGFPAGVDNRNARAPVAFQVKSARKENAK